MDMNCFPPIRSRIPCWTEKWLGWQDSNLRMAIPKTAALPLGYTPKRSPFYSPNNKSLQAIVCQTIPKQVNFRYPLPRSELAGKYRWLIYGVWRSLVAHVVRDDGVAGSNPATPTSQ